MMRTIKHTFAGGTTTNITGINEILQFDSNTETWNLTGRISVGRPYTAASVVSADISQYCLYPSGISCK